MNLLLDDSNNTTNNTTNNTNNLNNNDPVDLKILPINPGIFQEDTLITKGLAGLVLGGVLYLMYSIVKAFLAIDIGDLNINKFITFLDQKNVLAIMIGLMIASNARDLIKSITNNFIMPLLEPIMPFIKMQYKVQIGPFKFEFGKLVSDIIMFLINIYIIYILVAMFSTDIDIRGAIAF